MPTEPEASRSASASAAAASAAARHTTEEVSNIVNNTDMLALESNLRYSSIAAAQNKAQLIISGNTDRDGDYWCFVNDSYPAV